MDTKRPGTVKRKDEKMFNTIHVIGIPLMIISIAVMWVGLWRGPGKLGSFAWMIPILAGFTGAILSIALLAS
jgi:hypothetical protein